MYEDFAPKLARVLTEYSRPVNPGDYVLIRAEAEAMPLIEALYEAVLRRGGHPEVQMLLPRLSEILVRDGSEEQLRYGSPKANFLIENVDVMYSIYAESNPKNLSGYPSEKVAQRFEGRRAWLETYHRRFADGTLRWAISAWPSAGMAQQADMGLLAYTDFIYKACAFDTDDPVAHWVAFRERQDRLVSWLNGKQHAEVTGPGIELSFDFVGRKWINAHGDLNFPDGEIYTGPVEDSVNGHVEFNYPTVFDYVEVDGVNLTFKGGVVTDASAEKGEAHLLAKLDADPGARRLGEFAIGTNMGIQQFTGMTLFDEKIGGTIHMALGRSIPMTLGQNKSAVHWDMVHDMTRGGEIRIDGELFYQNGKFVIE